MARCMAGKKVISGNVVGVTARSGPRAVLGRGGRRRPSFGHDRGWWRAAVFPAGGVQKMAIGAAETAFLAGAVP